MASNRYPTDIGKYPYTHFRIVEFRNRNFIRDNSNGSATIEAADRSPRDKVYTLDNIYLPLPNSISNNYGLSWDMSDMRLIEGIRDIMADPSEAGGIALGTANAILLGDFTKKFTFATPNPKKQALFNGIEPRQFNFTYQLTPNTEKEANDIQNIVEVVTKHALPSKKDYSFFDFPAEFKIDFGNVKGFPDIKYCVCTGISTDYTPQSAQILRSGHAVQINLSLSFLETDLRTKEDIGV